MVAVIQPSFAKGELAPSLHARVDLATYQTGAAVVRNFIVQAHGGVVNRPGTRIVAEVANTAVRSRLIPFAYNTQQTYVLEFGHLEMRVIKDGGQVLGGAGQPYAITTPYAESDLPTLKFTQSADVMTLTHPAHPPADLSRTGHDAWTLTPISFQPTVPAPGGVSVAAINNDPGEPQAAWYYVVTTERDTEESLASAEASVINRAALNSGTGVINVISWSAVPGASAYKVYKRRNGVFGFIGTTSATVFEDQNIQADLSAAVQEFRNPLDGAGNWPGVVEYHQQRRVFAASANQPQTLWFSQSANFRNMNVSNPTRDDDAITRTIAAKQVNEVRGLVSLKGLIVLTSGAEFNCTAGSGDVLTPAQTTITPQSYVGSSHLPPIVVGNVVLFNQARGGTVRALRYDYQADGFAAQDMSILARHLFTGYALHEWAWAAEPYRVAWCVRSDGVLLGFTYMQEQEVYAWHRHQTQGIFESVAVIAEGNEDAVYVIVRRDVQGVQRRYIERFASRTGYDGSWFLDSALRYSGPPATTFSGLGHLEGKTVAIVGDGSVLPNAVVQGGSVTVAHAVSEALIGLSYDCDLCTLNVDLGQPTMQGKKVKIPSVTVRVEATRGLHAGPDLEHLTEIKERGFQLMGEPIMPFTGDQRVTLDSTWSAGGRTWIRQMYPLPASILAVIPEVVVGG